MSWPTGNSWPSGKSWPTGKSWPSGKSWPGDGGAPGAPITVTLNDPGQLYGRVDANVTGTYTGPLTALGVYLNDVPIAVGPVRIINGTFQFALTPPLTVSGSVPLRVVASGGAPADNEITVDVYVPANRVLQYSLSDPDGFTATDANPPVLTGLINQASGVTHNTGTMPSIDTSGLDGKPAVIGNGSTQFVSSTEAALVALGQNATAFSASILIRNTVDAFDYFFCWGKAATPALGLKLFGMANTGTGRLFFKTTTDSGTAVSNTVSTDYDHTTAHVVSVVFTGTTVTIYVDGVVTSVNAAANAPATALTPDIFYFLRSSESSAGYADGLFGELLIVSGAIDATEVGKHVTYLKTEKRRLHVSDVAGTSTSVFALNVYSGTTNNLGIRQHVAVTAEDPGSPGTFIQVLGWARHSDRIIHLSKRTLPAGSWSTVTGGATIHSGDQHYYQSIAIDAAGYVHTSHDTHADVLTYYKGSAPFALDAVPADATAQAALPLVAGNLALENEHTYPVFVLTDDGDMQYFWRTGSSGNGNLVQYRYNGSVWASVHNTLFDGVNSTPTQSLYPDRFYYKDGRIHLSGCLRVAGEVSTNYNKVYMYSDDSGDTWKAANGSSVTIPVTDDTIPVARAITINTGLINSQAALMADDSGNPIIPHWVADGTTKVSITHWHSGAWVTDLIWTDPGAFTLIDQAAPPASGDWPVGCPGGEYIGGYAMIFYTAESQGPGVWVAVCEKQSGHYVRIDNFRLTRYDIRFSHPVHDLERFRQSGILSFIATRTYNGVAAGTVPGFVIDWDPTAYLAMLAA